MDMNDERQIINIQPDMLPISLEVYARRTEQSISAVRKQAYEGSIPTIQMEKGAKVYVNQAKMVMSSLEAAGWNVRVPQDIYSV